MATKVDQALLALQATTLKAAQAAGFSPTASKINRAKGTVTFTLFTNQKYEYRVYARYDASGLISILATRRGIDHMDTHGFNVTRQTEQWSEATENELPNFFEALKRYAYQDDQWYKFVGLRSISVKAKSGYNEAEKKQFIQTMANQMSVAARRAGFRSTGAAVYDINNLSVAIMLVKTKTAMIKFHAQYRPQNTGVMGDSYNCFFSKTNMDINSAGFGDARQTKVATYQSAEQFEDRLEDLRNNMKSAEFWSAPYSGFYS